MSVGLPPAKVFPKMTSNETHFLVFMSLYNLLPHERELDLVTTPSNKQNVAK